MACKNCKCDPVAVEEDKEVTWELIDSFNKELSSINSFLREKFPDDFKDYIYTCGGWFNDRVSKKRENLKLEETLSLLRKRGYTILEPTNVTE